MYNLSLSNLRIPALQPYPFLPHTYQTRSCRVLFESNPIQSLPFLLHLHQFNPISTYLIPDSIPIPITSLLFPSQFPISQFPISQFPILIPIFTPGPSNPIKILWYPILWSLESTLSNQNISIIKVLTCWSFQHLRRFRVKVCEEFRVKQMSSDQQLH